MRWDWLFQDLGGFVLAMALHPLVVLLPGAALSRLLPASLRSSAGGALGCALLSGFALVPPILDYCGRFGPSALVAADLALAGLGGLTLWRRRRLWRLRAWRWPLALFVITAALMLACSLAIPANGDIWLNLVVVDHVKHAAVADMIAQTGTPPRNLLAAPEFPALRYYYYFYLAPAVLDLLGGSWIEARHAVFGSAPWLMLGLYCLALTTLRAVRPAAQADAAAQRRWPKIIVSLLLVSGCAVLLAATGFSPHADQLDLFLLGVLWVPQHTQAALAGVFGVLVAATCVVGDGGRPSAAGAWRRGAVAGALSFATCFAASVYVGFGVGLSCAAWLGLCLLRRDWAGAARLLATGVLAVGVLSPFLSVLVQGQMAAQNPDPLVWAWRAPPFAAIFGVALPTPLRTVIFYAAALGVLGFGGARFLRDQSRDVAGHGVQRALALTAACCLVAGTVARSNILGNDFGWRVLMPTEFVLLIWTALAMSAASRPGRGLRALMVLGRADLLAALVSLFLVLPSARTETLFGDPAALSAAADRDFWEHVGVAVAPGAVVQLRPTATPQWAAELYRNRPAAVTDAAHGLLYGANPAALRARSEALARLFIDPTLDAAGFNEVAARYRLAYVAVSRADPAWAGAAWLVGRTPVFQNAKYRLYTASP